MSIEHMIGSYWASPGSFLLEWLEENNRTQDWLAKQVGRSAKNINQVIKAKAPLKPGLALDLERVTGIPAEKWVVTEAHYRLNQERCARKGIPVDDENSETHIPEKEDPQAVL